MITERTLRKWRREGLWLRSSSVMGSLQWQLAERILRLTQELLDQHLLKKE